MLTVEQAAIAILSPLSPLPAIKKPLEESLDYYLAQAIQAERDAPPFDRITHDGIAIAFAAYQGGGREFCIEEYAAAGKPQMKMDNSGNAMEVATGAPLPQGCDTVIPYELFTREDNRAILNAGAMVKLGDCIHPQGSDLKRDEIVLEPGCRIGVAEVAVLAANGIAHVPVHAKPSIGILATGDELVEVDKPIKPFQIRRSNDHTLKAALRLNGFEEVDADAAPDDKAAIKHKLLQLMANKAVVLITGGVSKGARDYVPETLQEIGVNESFHHVAQRPGKPLWFGRNASSLVFGLPGNPNSALVCLIRYVLPALRRLSGGRITLPKQKRLAAATVAHEALTLFVPVRLLPDDSVAPMSTHTSGDFTGLLGSDGFIELPSRASDYDAGEKAGFYPWRQ